MEIIYGMYASKNASDKANPSGFAPSEARMRLAEKFWACRQPSGFSVTPSSSFPPEEDADESSFSSSQNVFSLTSERVVT